MTDTSLLFFFAFVISYEHILSNSFSSHTCKIRFLLRRRYEFVTSLVTTEVHLLHARITSLSEWR